MKLAGTDAQWQNVESIAHLLPMIQGELLTLLKHEAGNVVGHGYRLPRIAAKHRSNVGQHLVVKLDLGLVELQGKNTLQILLRVSLKINSLEAILSAGKIWWASVVLNSHD